MIKLTPLYQFIKNTFIYIYDKLLYKSTRVKIFDLIYLLACIFFNFRLTYTRTSLQMRKKDRNHSENDMENSSYASNILSTKMASYYIVLGACNDVMFVITHTF